MPVKNSTNNRILPANARASDVASRAISEILPVQQLRNMSAMRVQGYQCLHYSHLKQGPKCSCQASQKQLGSRLGLDGKASVGTINELLTGAMTFDVTPYGSRRPQQTSAFDSVTSPLSPHSPFQGQFDVVGIEEGNSLPLRIENGPSFGDNGPAGFNIDDLVSDFDSAHMGFTDATCAVCFGTGFIGGYSPFNANRQIFTVNDVDLGASEIDLLTKPWQAESLNFSFTVTLPLGAVGIDTFRVMNNSRQVNANFTVDQQAANPLSILQKCDGLPHLVNVAFPQDQTWTHVEIQFILGSESAYFEFPRLTKGSDTAQLEQLEPFQIIIGSNLPNLSPQDIITESVFGKALIVESSNWWNDKNRNVLGWECQVRVLQPQELYNILPRRGRIMTKNQTPIMVHDNKNGTYRT